ncbi:GAF and ANTAR domain-containing protein [Nonomuraea sp. NPDC050663]|uniref:GAF and ANTAR domain-containing protein n=1 Tax=Nonomuraea sp. NPDC050663 TaxID=3364370 RepID=UPI00378FBDCF
MSRDAELADAFVGLADTLVEDFDVIDFLEGLTGHCVSLLAVDAAGLLLAGSRERLQLVAASSEQARLLELFQLQADEGPCVECYRSGQRVDFTATEPRRWPSFSRAAQRAGFASVCALPMRHQGSVIGALNLFRASPVPLGETEVRIAQALADVATIGILQERTARQRELVAEQLQHALHSRVVIEQAKGVLAERMDTTVDLAFEELRRFARSGNHRLSDIALAVIEGKGWQRVPQPGTTTESNT